MSEAPETQKVGEATTPALGVGLQRRVIPPDGGAWLDTYVTDLLNYCKRLEAALADYGMEPDDFGRVEDLVATAGLWMIGGYDVLERARWLANSLGEYDRQRAARERAV